MRFVAKYTLSGAALLFAALLAGSVSVTSCRHDHHDLDTVAINPGYATDPPIPEDLTLQLLDKPSEEGNAVLRVRFPAGKIGSPYLAFRAEEKKVVLRDDGVAPDDKKDDGVYSGIVQVDIAALQQIEARQGILNVKEAIPTKEFQGRFVAGTVRILPLDLNAPLNGSLIHPHFPLMPPSPQLVDSIQANSIFVIAPSVVEDTSRTYDPCSNKGHKMGRWTFGFLMTQLADTAVTHISPSRFVLNWLLTFTRSQTVNSDPLDARPNMASFIHQWLVKSNGLQDSTLDLSIAPFRLIGIVNRLDLRSNPGYLGNGGNAGEGRMVFSALDSNCNPALFNVNFEYGVNRTSCGSINAYAMQWYNLKNLTVGSAAYNDSLQVITDEFTLAGTNPAKPNGSSLDQLRTDEIALGANWELREFNIDSVSHMLFSTTVKQTPQAKFDMQNILDTFFVHNAAAIKVNTDILPVSLPFNGVNTPFLGGMAPNPPSYWAEPGAALTNNDTVREVFSLNTCQGCHNIETGTLFRQLIPGASYGSPAVMSGFLTGVTIVDPAEIPGTWQFSDLQRRALDLVNLVNSPCFLMPFGFRPLNMTH